jgi:small subunit ribosomal protein S9
LNSRKMATKKAAKTAVGTSRRKTTKVKPALIEKKEKYWEATGRRKTAVARVRITEAKKPEFVVNHKPFEDYFQDEEYRITAKEALERAAAGKPFLVSILVRGGGMRAQAEAVRHALARVLVEWDSAMREHMKVLKFLTRDPRMRERKKFGLKRARRARQWRKR